MINRLVLACSGLLGLKVLAFLQKQGVILAVLTDKNSHEIIDYCLKNEIVYFAGHARSDNCFKFIQKYKDAILLSVNYLFLFDERLLNVFTHKFNIHGSLLPKYRGRTPHVWAIINNEKYTGITIHDIVSECDSGNIFLQKRIPIKYTDTGGIILKKYIYHYPRMINQFLDMFSQQRLMPIKQNNDLMTYFGKRTPEDGRIIWSWQRECIYNWVRALAPPYPGAFCFLNNTKIIINKVVFSDFGFSWDMKNGIILDVGKNNMLVKTPNGCVLITDFLIEDSHITVKQGDILF